MVGPLKTAQWANLAWEAPHCGIAFREVSLSRGQRLPNNVVERMHWIDLPGTQRFDGCVHLKDTVIVREEQGYPILAWNSKNPGERIIPSSRHVRQCR